MEAEAQQRSAGSHYEEFAEPCWDAHFAEHLSEALAGVGDGVTALVAECRSGLLIQRLAEEAPSLKRIMAVDMHRELLNHARSRIGSKHDVPVFFNSQRVTSLNFADGVFGVALCGGGISTGAEVLNAMSELGRVVAPGGLIAVAATGRASFPIISELLREVAWSADDPEWHSWIAEYEEVRVHADEMHQASERVGLTYLDGGSEIIEVGFEGPAEFFEHPLIRQEVLDTLKHIGENPEVREAIFADLKRRLDTYLDERPFVSTVELVWAVLRASGDQPLTVDDLDVLSEAVDTSEAPPRREATEVETFDQMPATAVAPSPRPELDERLYRGPIESDPADTDEVRVDRDVLTRLRTGDEPAVEERASAPTPPDGARIIDEPAPDEHSALHVVTADEARGVVDEVLSAPYPTVDHADDGSDDSDAFLAVDEEEVVEIEDADVIDEAYETAKLITPGVPIESADYPAADDGPISLIEEEEVLEVDELDIVSMDEED